MRLSKLGVAIGLFFVFGSVVTAEPPADGKIIYLGGYAVFDIDQKRWKEDPILKFLHESSLEIICRWGNRLYWRDRDQGILYCLEYDPDLERQVCRVENELVKNLEEIDVSSSVELSELNNTDKLSGGLSTEKNRIGFNFEVFDARVNSENVEMNRLKKEFDFKLTDAKVAFRSRDIQYRKMIDERSRKIGPVDDVLLWIYPDSGMLLSKRDVNTKARVNGKKGQWEYIYYVQLSDGQHPILNSRDMNECCAPGYSFADGLLYYVNLNGVLIEKNVVASTENVVANLSQFIEQQQLSSQSWIRLGPGSPDRQYIPIIVNRTLYLIKRTGEIRRVTGPFLGFWGAGITGDNIFWDKTSKYVIFPTLFDWFPSFDFINSGYSPTEIGYYNVETGELGRIDTGSRFNIAFFFDSW